MDIELTSEHEGPAGWTYTARIGPPQAWVGTVELAYADYERWAKGSMPPAAIADAAIRTALDHNAVLPRAKPLNLGRLHHTIANFERHLIDRLNPPR